MMLCSNCLQLTNNRPIPVGHISGPQRDPYQRQINLCEYCEKALVSADFVTFNERFTKERQISRD